MADGRHFENRQIAISLQPSGRFWWNLAQWCKLARGAWRKVKFLTIGAVKRPILHQQTKFRKDQSNRCGDIAIFLWFFKMAAAAILGVLKIRNFSGLSPVRGQFASSCKISSKSVNRLRRYGDLMGFFKMAAVRHLGFVGRALGRPTKTTCWSLSLC